MTSEELQEIYDCIAKEQASHLDSTGCYDYDSGMNIGFWYALTTIMDISVDKHIPINFTRFDKEGKKINE
jgi:hypothetical protein